MRDGFLALPPLVLRKFGSVVRKAGLCECPVDKPCRNPTQWHAHAYTCTGRLEQPHWQLATCAPAPITASSSASSSHPVQICFHQPMHIGASDHMQTTVSQTTHASVLCGECLHTVVCTQCTFFLCGGKKLLNLLLHNHGSLYSND